MPWKKEDNFLWNKKIILLITGKNFPDFFSFSLVCFSLNQFEINIKAI